MKVTSQGFYGQNTQTGFGEILVNLSSMQPFRPSMLCCISLWLLNYKVAFLKYSSGNGTQVSQQFEYAISSIPTTDPLSLCEAQE